MTHLSSTELGSFHVVCISSLSVHNAELSLRSRNFALYTLESEGIVDKHSLLKGIARSLRIPIAQNSSLTSWDAASDLAWQALMERTESRVAILWREAHNVIDCNLQIFLDAIQFFCELAEAVERQVESEDTHPILFRVVAFGSDHRFSPWV